MHPNDNLLLETDLMRTASANCEQGYVGKIADPGRRSVSKHAWRTPPVEGGVRFGAPDDFGTRFLPNILSRFARSHPQVEVEVVLAPSVKLQKQFEAGEIDLIMVTTNQSDAGAAQGRTIFSEPLIWVGTKGGEAKNASPLPLALSGHGCVWRSAALASLHRAKRAYRTAYTCENCQGQLAALLADLAIAPLPASLLSSGYERLGKEHGLPEIGHYQLRLCETPGIGAAGLAFSAHVAESFAELT